MHTNTHTLTETYTPANFYTCTYMYKYTHTHMHTHIHIHIHIHTCMLLQKNWYAILLGILPGNYSSFILKCRHIRFGPEK